MLSDNKGMGKKDLKIKIGERFRQMRNYVGLSQKEIADIFGMNQSNIVRIEKGVVFPNMSICHYFKSHYDIDTNWLISGSGEMLIKDNSVDRGVDYAEFSEEMEDILFYLDNVPDARLAVLKFFVGYKLENKREILEYLEEKKVMEG